LDILAQFHVQGLSQIGSEISCLSERLYFGQKSASARISVVLFFYLIFFVVIIHILCFTILRNCGKTWTYWPGFTDKA